MLWSARDRELGQILSAADEAPRGRTACGSKPEQGLKCGHRGLTSIEPKDKLIKIALKVFWIYTMMSSGKPCL